MHLPFFKLFDDFDVVLYDCVLLLQFLLHFDELLIDFENVGFSFWFCWFGKTAIRVSKLASTINFLGDGLVYLGDAFFGTPLSQFTHGLGSIAWRVSLNIPILRLI